MQACPICNKDQGPTCDRPTIRTLTEHVEQAHQACFVAGNRVRPWRCPLCQSRRSCFKGCENLAKHLVQAHWGDSAPRPARSVAAKPPSDSTFPIRTQQAAQECATVLHIPCVPWLPRPKWWLRPPKATLLLASWNLEHFSLSAGDTGVAARKLGNICTTLRQLVEREGPAASVVVALQEVFCPRAVAFVASYLTETEATGSGRVWHSHTSEPLGNNAERAAFLWSGPPTPPPLRARPQLPPVTSSSEDSGGNGASNGNKTAAAANSEGTSARSLDSHGPSPVSPLPHHPPPATTASQSAAPSAHTGLCLAWCGCGTEAAVAAPQEATGGGSSVAPSPLSPGRAGGRGAQAPLHADPSMGFQLLSGELREAVIRSGQGPPRDGSFLRSPFFGLFRVGYCNLLVVNVHLAARADAARSELSSLHLLAEAIQSSNDRLFRRRFARLGACGGALFPGSRQPRGLLAVVGDFNCPVGRAVPAGAAMAPLTAPGPGAVPVAALETAGPGTRTGEGSPVKRSQPGVTRGVQGGSGSNGGCSTAGGVGGHGGGGRRFGTGGAGSGDVGNVASWEAFRRNGWVNVLAERACDRNGNGNSGGNGNGNGAGAGDGDGFAGPIATNWYAKQPKALDAICLQRDLLGAQSRGSPLVTGRGVCPPPPYVDAAAGAAGMYPNHLLCWVRLDLRSLQRAPGKVRQLLGPTRVALPENHTQAPAQG